MYQGDGDLALIAQGGREESKMFTFQQIRALQEHRFGNEAGRQRRRKPQVGLRDLLRSLAGVFSTLGFRGRDGSAHPAGPAY
jgi:hypothetical protein